jgi:cell division cycle 20-like protein 1 (cofactor of APC complex)
MSHLTNSPFGKRLRSVGNKELDDDEAVAQDPPSPTRGRPRINPIFGVAPPVLSLETHTSQGGSRNTSPGSPSSRGSPKRDYGDRFVLTTDRLVI